MTAILRLGSMLMILLVTAPTVRDCCVPVTQAQPCHESKHDNELTCSARQQAVAENKAAAVTTRVQSQFYIAAYLNPTVLTELRPVIHRAVSAPLPANDIYLRIGTFLI